MLPSHFGENIRISDITPTKAYRWDSLKMHKGCNGHHTCDSMESQAIIELLTCQNTTTEQFLLDLKQSGNVVVGWVSGQRSPTNCGVRLQGSHEQRRHAKHAVASIPAEAAVPCLTCCCGPADSEWHHAGRFDADGTQEVCRVNGDVKHGVTEVHRSGSSTWQRDCAAGEMMGLHYSDSQLLPLVTKADVIKVEKTFMWECEVSKSACPLANTSADGPDLRRLKWFACSPRKNNIQPKGGKRCGWRRGQHLVSVSDEQFKKSLKGMFWNFTAKGSLLNLSPY